MGLLLLSFIAGVLTVLAPCILPLLPVIIGGSIARGKDNDSKTPDWYRPLIIAGSLGLSVVLFTLLLKATTSLLGVPQTVWQIISGVIVIALGINFLKPDLWEKLPGMSQLNIKSNKALAASYQRKDLIGDALLGLSLGPVFSSCSPTYALIVAAVLPVSFLEGLTYLTTYAIGLAGMLLVIAYAGQGIVRRLGWLSNPTSMFKKIVGILFILVGLAVITGFDKKVQVYVLERGWYNPVSQLEESLR